MGSSVLASDYGKPSTTNEAAAKCLQKAIALRPTRLMHYIELGRVYAQMGRKEEARRLINKGLAMLNVEKDDPEMKRLDARRSRNSRQGRRCARLGRGSFTDVPRQQTIGQTARPPPINLWCQSCRHDRREAHSTESRGSEPERSSR